MKTPDTETKPFATSNQKYPDSVSESPKKFPLTPLLVSALGIVVVAGVICGGYWYQTSFYKKPQEVQNPLTASGPPLISPSPLPLKKTPIPNRLRIIYTSGTVFPDGSVDLYPFYITEGYPDEITEDGPYNIRLLDKEENIISQQHFKQTAAELPEEGAAVSFFVVLPIPRDIAVVQIREDEKVLKEITPSDNAPVVRITLPTGNETISRDGSLRIAWEGYDEDKDNLYYQVEYSFDGGNSWRTHGINITNNSLTIASENLPGTDEAKVRVLASDGINTGSDVSNTFVVENKPPSVFINQPEDKAKINQSDNPVRFSGDADDREDGKNVTLKWKIDGEEVGGYKYFEQSLPVGTHEITLMAIDSQGETSQKSIFITIEEG